MIKKIITLAIALGMTIAMSAAGINTKSYDFGEITAINATFWYKIEVSYGKTDKIVVSYPEEFEKYLNIKCSNGTLNLLHNNNSFPRRHINSIIGKGDMITVKLQMRTINELNLSGGSKLYPTGNFKAENTFICNLSGAASIVGTLNISAYAMEYKFSGATDGHIKGSFDNVSGTASGASDVILELLGNTDRFDAKLSGAVDFDAYAENVTGKTVIEASGASNAIISGKTESIFLRASGACDINTKEMTANSGTATASGSSSIRIYGKEHLDLEVSGAADIKYYGTCRESEVVKRLPKYAASIESGN